MDRHKRSETSTGHASYCNWAGADQSLGKYVMLKLWMMLTCILFLGSLGTSQAAPLDASDIVYIDGLPCNRACQSYMALYRKLAVPRQTAPVSAQPEPAELSEQSPRAEAQPTTKKREARPANTCREESRTETH
jgi:hypothetical protein